MNTSIFCRIIVFFLKKMGQSRPLFCLFLFFSHYNFNTNWKKRRWCAWDSNPGPQYGRRRQNHRAMAATQHTCLIINPIVHERFATFCTSTSTSRPLSRLFSNYFWKRESGESFFVSQPFVWIIGWYWSNYTPPERMNSWHLWTALDQLDKVQMGR